MTEMPLTSLPAQIAVAAMVADLADIKGADKQPDASCVANMVRDLEGSAAVDCFAMPAYVAYGKNGDRTPQIAVMVADLEGTTENPDSSLPAFVAYGKAPAQIHTADLTAQMVSDLEGELAGATSFVTPFVAFDKAGAGECSRSKIAAMVADLEGNTTHAGLAAPTFVAYGKALGKMPTLTSTLTSMIFG